MDAHAQELMLLHMYLVYHGCQYIDRPGVLVYMYLIFLSDMVVLYFTEHDILGAGKHRGPVLEGGGGRKAGHRLPAPGTDHRTTRCTGECLDCLFSESVYFRGVDNILTGINY